jgi:hypothetical protein
MDKRFRSLRTIANIYKILGAITLAVTFLIILGIFVSSFTRKSASAETTPAYNLLPSNPLNMLSGITGAIGLSLGALIYGGAASLTLYALGEGVELFIAMEENTRISAQALQRLSTRAPQPPRTSTAPMQAVPQEEPKPRQGGGLLDRVK